MFDLATIVGAVVPLMREVLSGRQVMAQAARLSGNIGLGFVTLARLAKWLRIREF
jgi:hypothetical protein